MNPRFEERHASFRSDMAAAQVCKCLQSIPANHSVKRVFFSPLKTSNYKFGSNGLLLRCICRRGREKSPLVFSEPKTLAALSRDSLFRVKLSEKKVACDQCKRFRKNKRNNISNGIRDVLYFSSPSTTVFLLFFYNSVASALRRKTRFPSRFI